MSTLLEATQKALREKSASSWNTYVGGSRFRETVAWGISLLATAGSIIAISLAWHYAGTIAWVTQIDEVDRYGQLLDTKAVVRRAGVDVLAHHVINNFITYTFEVVDSRFKMQANSKASQHLLCSPTARGNVINYWQQSSPLGSDGSWTKPTMETDVAMTSFLSRPNSEYQVQWTSQGVYTNGERTPATLWQADIVLQPGAAVTDDNVGGLCISHLTFSEVK